MIIPNENKVFEYFEEIIKIPRGSGNEKEISDYIANFARERNLEAVQDSENNVIVKKNAFPEYEDKAPVILQGHIDMVCVKKSGIDHDFLKDPIKAVVNGDFISADGTSLGADDGIGVAYMLALLDSEDIPHPPLECVFTADEEVGMGGAKSLDMSGLNGRRLINIDSENEGVFCVSCAGGVRVNLTIPLEWDAEKPSDFKGFDIKITGLLGGHSGSDIHLQRASAIKLMGRILNRISGETEIRIADISGGSADNAIAAFAQAEIFVNKDYHLEETLNQLKKEFNREYKSAGESIYLSMEEARPERILTTDASERIIKALVLIPYGVNTVSLEMENLVESSCNPGVVSMDGKEFLIKCAVRSSTDIRKRVQAENIKILASLVGGRTWEQGDYPSWEYNPDSRLMDFVPKLYEKMFGKNAKIESIHAGLECGVFAGKIPGIDMISFGPDLFEVHSVNERLSISSAERMWDFLKEILKNID